MKDDKTLSFMKSLFMGEIQQEILFPYPQQDEDEKENLKMILQAWNEFAENSVDPVEIDKIAQIPDEVMDGMKEIGMFGLPISDEYEGAGVSKTSYCRVFEEICRYDTGIAVMFGAHASIGTNGIVLFGTEKQKAKYLPKLASGEYVAAFALTEPGAGSDAAGIKTKAVLNKNKTAFILNGEKIWITNGGVAQIATVFAKTTVQQNGEEKEKITAFIVELDSEGVSRGKKEHKLGIRGSNTASLNFDNVVVPVENMLGPIGKGFLVAMETLNTGRLGLAAGCIGGMKELLRQAMDHAKSREQFQKTLDRFQLIKQKIAKIASETYALESIVYLTTGLHDKGGIDVSLESAICKIYGSEVVWDASDEVVQIAGGLGYSADYPYERYLRDARIHRIFEGTNEILRMFVALSGIQGPGEYLKNVGKALRNPIKGFGLLTGFAAGKVKDTIARDELKNVCEELKEEAEQFNALVARLAAITESVLRKYGKKIIVEQYTLNRIANIAIELLGMAAVISRVDTRLKEGKSIEKDLPLAKLFCNEAASRARREARYVDRNHDKERSEIAEFLSETGKYPMDMLMEK
ncbi:MAG: acyl-CoA dehydrogenase family protein [Deferribacteres bacterium]|nr:acyl-CoA dehydrogenase family protein [candidate division KSB1 bacterium]MCB9502312.1 acyl-CoA dehydrogenase family protein [Deferribacteres bacterium]